MKQMKTTKKKGKYLILHLALRPKTTENLSFAYLSKLTRSSC